MDILKVIDDLAEWAREKIVPRLAFKEAPADDREETSGYEYRLVHPRVFTLFFPEVEKGEDKRTAPGLLIQMVEGEHDAVSRKGSLEIRFVLQVWNPGLHTEQGFTPNGEGWRDLFFFMDTVLSSIEGDLILNGHRVRTDTLSFSPAKEDKALVDHYPYFIGEVRFSVDFFRTSQPSFLEKLL